MTKKTTSDDGVEPTTIYGFEIPDGTEDETERDGVLSSKAEVHSFVLGLVAGMTGHIEIIALFVAFVMGTADSLRKTSHLRDAAKESAYAVGGVFLGVVIHLLLWATILDGFLAGGVG